MHTMRIVFKDGSILVRSRVWSIDLDEWVLCYRAGSSLLPVLLPTQSIINLTISTEGGSK